MVHLILHNKFSFTELWAQVLDWSQCPGNPGCINTQQARQWQHYKLAHLYTDHYCEPARTCCIVNVHTYTETTR